jgi:lipopolysaccharide/colanic/teichoic acid biosynthesis glycosyltransferase
MKIVISGASGFLGQILVPLLEKKGHQVIPLGRSLGKLDAIFPGRENMDYESNFDQLSGVNVFLHLAVLNSDIFSTDSEFTKVNDELTIRMAELARKIEASEYVFVSSFHALDKNNLSQYAASKRSAIEKLKAFSGVRCTVFHLPLVYSKTWSGKLRVLNKLPSSIATMIFRALSAMKPSLDVARFAEELLANRQSDGFSEMLLADDLGENNYYTFTKKFLDMLAGVVIIVGLSWLLFLLWLLIKAGSSGSGFFEQQRVGRHGQTFTCYKFRTMKVGTLQVGTHEVQPDSVTRLGKFLRRYKLDELPQALNLLKGEMSLVGPRPSLPIQTDVLKKRQFFGVLDMLPGITGLSQVMGVDMSDATRLAETDAIYMQTRSLSLDAKLIWATICGKGMSDRIKFGA